MPKLMTYDEYAHYEHPIPYSLTLKAPEAYLYYFGERHTFDPKDEQWESLKKLWSEFLVRTEVQRVSRLLKGVFER